MCNVLRDFQSWSWGKHDMYLVKHSTNILHKIFSANHSACICFQASELIWHETQDVGYINYVNVINPEGGLVGP